MRTPWKLKRECSTGAVVRVPRNESVCTLFVPCELSRIIMSPPLARILVFVDEKPILQRPLRVLALNSIPPPAPEAIMLFVPEP